MRKIIKIAFAYGFFLAAATCSYGAIGLPSPMKGPPPKAEHVGDVLFDVSDIPRSVKIGRDAVLYYLRAGEFMTFPREVSPKITAFNEILKPDKEDANGRFNWYIGGCFATNQGKVFMFRPVNARVLEIWGIDGGGFFVLPDTDRSRPNKNANPNEKK